MFGYSGDLGAFSLSDGGVYPNGQTFAGLVPGTYAVSEVLPLPGDWTLDDIVCTDPDGQSSIDLGTATATIDLDAGENITCTFTNSKPTSTTCPEDMVNYWKLDEDASTSTFVDYVGGLDLTCMTGQCPVDDNLNGRVDACQDFDGTDDLLSSTGMLLNPTNALTVMAWVNPDTLTGSVDKGVVYKDGVFLLELEASTSFGVDFTVLVDGGSAAEYQPSGAAVPAGQWSHIAGTYDGSMVKVFLNGSQITGSASKTGTIDSVSSPIVVGKSVWSGTERPFDGLIDEVAIFDVALTELEIQEYYNKGFIGDPYCEEEAPAPTPDYDKDGDVDGYDLAMFVLGFGPNYDPLCDYDQDGFVDEIDLGTFSGEFGY